MRWIASGPLFQVTKYSSYEIGGVRFNTISKDNDSVTQNSGVSLVASIMQYASVKDNNPVFGEMTFYGVVTEIWDLNYNKFCIPIFKCDWVDNNSGIRHDELGFTCVDLKKLGHKSDPFILASQAKQVFYIKDPIDPRWHVVLLATKYEETDDKLFEDAPNDTLLVQGLLASRVPNVEDSFDDDNCENIYVQNDCERIWVNTL